MLAWARHGHPGGLLVKVVKQTLTLKSDQSETGHRRHCYRDRDSALVARVDVEGRVAFLWRVLFREGRYYEIHAREFRTS